MTTRTSRRLPLPIIGVAFEPDFMNEAGRLNSYASELRYYRPAGFSKLAREMEAAARMIEDGRPCDSTSDLMDSADDMLSECGRARARHDFIRYGVADAYSAIGYFVDVDSFLREAERFDDLANVPRGYSGLVAIVTDHGNVSGFSYSRGRARELFAIV